MLFTLQGIPSLYYGIRIRSHRHDALGKPDAFDTSGETYREVAAISRLRTEEPAIRYGRLYFREVSGNGQDFGHSAGRGVFSASGGSRGRVGLLFRDVESL